MKKEKIYFIIVLLLMLGLSACHNQEEPDVDVSNIQTKVEIIRFDQDFYLKPVAELPAIKKKYAYMFSPKVPDSIWIKKMQDTLFIALKKAVNKTFPNMDAYKNDIADVFRHVKYYHPDFKAPVIVTLYSDWNYRQRAIYADSLLFLSLDNFLGKDNPIYKGIPQYIKRELDPKRIPIEIAKAVINKQVAPPKSKTFISKMINFGKRLYLLDKYVPLAFDEQKIGYTKEKMQWAKDNEEQVWQYFIEKKLLYNSAGTLDMRFLNLAPYSKFYSEEDSKTPGKIGQYIGWQIVRSYMKKNKVSLQKLITEDEETIFKQSKYKPRK